MFHVSIDFNSNVENTCKVYRLNVSLVSYFFKELQQGESMD